MRHGVRAWSLGVASLFLHFVDQISLISSQCDGSHSKQVNFTSQSQQTEFLSSAVQKG